MKNFNLTIMGDPASGKSSLFRKLVNFNSNEVLENTYYPCKMIKEGCENFKLNICEVRENLTHVIQTVEQIFKSDFIIYVMSLEEAENKFAGKHFTPASYHSLLKQKRLIEKDQNNQRIHFNDCKKRKPKKTAPQVQKSLMKSPYDSFLQALINLGLFYEFESRIIIYVNKCENENLEVLNSNIENFKLGLETFLKKSHIDINKTPVVFGSLKDDENIFVPSQLLNTTDPLFEIIYYKMDNYKGGISDNTIESYFPLRFSVHKTFKVMGTGIVAVGTLLNQSLKPGDEVIILPSMKTSTVKSIESYREACTEATFGGYYGVALKGIQLNEITKGSVICLKNQHSFEFPQRNLTILSRLSLVYVQNVLKKNSKFTFVGYNLRIPCLIEEIVETLDFDSNHLSANDVQPVAGTQVLAKITFLKPAYVEKYEEFSKLGRFILVNSNTIVANGVISDILDV
jgi:translation elongation factor EF-1alpha